MISHSDYEFVTTSTSVTCKIHGANPLHATSSCLQAVVPDLTDACWGGSVGRCSWVVYYNAGWWQWELWNRWFKSLLLLKCDYIFFTLSAFLLSQIWINCHFIIYSVIINAYGSKYIWKPTYIFWCHVYLISLWSFCMYCNCCLLLIGTRLHDPAVQRISGLNNKTFISLVVSLQVFHVY